MELGIPTPESLATVLPLSVIVSRSETTPLPLTITTNIAQPILESAMHLAASWYPHEIGMSELATYIKDHLFTYHNITWEVKHEHQAIQLYCSDAAIAKKVTNYMAFGEIIIRLLSPDSETFGCEGRAKEAVQRLQSFVRDSLSSLHTTPPQYPGDVWEV